mgnify:CR=1 FL=1
MRICKWCGHGHSFHKPLNMREHSDLEVCDSKGQVRMVSDGHHRASWRSGKDVEVCQCFGFEDMPDIAELWQSIDLCNETIKDGKKLGVDVSQLKQVVSKLMKAIKIIDKEREENI